MTEVPLWKPLLLLVAASAALWGAGGESSSPAPDSAAQVSVASQAADGYLYGAPVDAVSRPS